MNAVGPDELIGEVVDGRYTVLEQIAVGGMASVYRAVDTRLERDVALKVMKPHLANDTEFVSRFHREAKAPSTAARAPWATSSIRPPESPPSPVCAQRPVRGDR